MKSSQLLPICIKLFGILLILANKTEQYDRIIVDTDIGAWPDDAGSLAMLHKWADNGLLEIQAIMANNAYEGIVPVIDAMNHFYGRPEIPIGVTKDPNATSFTGDLHWQEWLLANFRHPKYQNNSQAPDSIQLYRKLLSKASNGSIKLLSIGYLTNLANLLETSGDEFSPLTGKELIQAKVSHTFVMGGIFPTGEPETNIAGDAKSSVKSLPHWPTPVIYSGFEVGDFVPCGRKLLNPTTNRSIDQLSPIGKFIELFTLKYGVEGCYDELATLIAVKGYENYFELVPGRIMILENGTNYWINDKSAPPQWYTKPKVSSQTLLDVIDPLFILPIATFCLGTWQIYRLKWKLNLIEKLNSLVKSDPVEFPEDLTNLQEKEYLKVRLNGYFDQTSQPIFIFPRPLLPDQSSKSEPSGSGLFSQSQSRNIGALMIMPFVVTEERLIQSYNQLLIQSDRSDVLINKKDFRILVNVGWISRELMDKINCSKDDQNRNKLVKKIVNSNIEMVGVIRKTEKREPFAPKNEVGSGYMSRRDIAQMADKLDTTPIFLDAHGSYPVTLSNCSELEIKPIGSQTRVHLRNEHLSYIITCLTGIFSYLWFMKIFRPRL
ncbi:hypothetical protein RDWZM_001716 [Blomia tropicalis]|uniref:SURF1-like protein n=1 Tax=Blomia tropicalis TaxID=40697 RepID=A0A9Q0MC72_BLOTA|nr:hypothetical protein RDWZM_001716 [Blomia tropicalis]